MNSFLRRMLLVWLAAAAGAHAQVDQRVLVLDNGRDKAITLTAAQLADQSPLLTLAIDDIEYGEIHTYAGFDLRAVLLAGGFREGEQLLLVCSDGYSIPFDSSVLQHSEWQGLLALRDEAASEGSYFVPFRHGGEFVDFAPFYLVWTPQADRASRLTARDLPWPYQLTEIRVQRPGDFAAALPPASADAATKAGFNLYYRQCIKCHSVNGSGGTLGPALDSTAALDALLASSDIRERITRISSFYATSKMPDFTDTFTDDELDLLLRYLQWAARAPAP